MIRSKEVNRCLNRKRPFEKIASGSGGDVRTLKYVTHAVGPRLKGVSNLSPFVIGF
jgi:hypothetical protein